MRISLFLFCVICISQCSTVYEWNFDQTLDNTEGNVSVVLKPDSAIPTFVYDEFLGKYVLALNDSSLLIPVPYHANGGGVYLRQWSLLVDFFAYIPDIPEALFSIFSSALLSRKIPELAISQYGAIGYAIQTTDDYAIPYGVWTQVGITVDTNKGHFKIFHNQTLIKTCNVAYGDEDLSLYVVDDETPFFSMFLWNAIPLNSSISRLKFWNETLSDSEMETEMDWGSTPVSYAEWNFDNTLQSTTGAGPLIPFGNDTNQFIFDSNLNKYYYSAVLSGLDVPSTYPPNGGGYYVNRYTMLFDIKVSFRDLRIPLYCSYPQGGFDAGLIISPYGALGVGYLYTDTLDYTDPNVVPLNEWVQIGYIVDMTTKSTTILFNKTILYSLYIEDGRDGYLSFYTMNDTTPFFSLFADYYGLVNISVSNFKFWNDSMSSTFILSMMRASVLPEQIQSKKSTKVNVGVVVGAVLGSVFGLAFVLFVLFGIYKYQKLSKTREQQTKDFELKKIEIEKNAKKVQELKGVTIERKIGAGNFGEVYFGKWEGSAVALKKLTMDQISEFEREAAILCDLQHPSVVRLLGLYRNDSDAYMVMEYVSKGSLLDVLKKESKHIEFKDQLDMIISAVQGMVYLESKGIVHRDIAARNLLVTKVDDRYQCKISDFGLSRDTTEYKVEGKILPIRWSAPEVLRQEVATIKSDVFSFGIAMWEIFEMGETPYPTIQRNRDVLDYVLSGKRLPRPQECPEEVFKTMEKCWEDEPSKRPSFKEILIELERYYTSVFVKDSPTSKSFVEGTNQHYDLSNMDQPRNNYNTFGHGENTKSSSQYELMKNVTSKSDYTTLTN